MVNSILGLSFLRWLVDKCANQMGLALLVLFAGVSVSTAVFRVFRSNMAIDLWLVAAAIVLCVGTLILKWDSLAETAQSRIHGLRFYLYRRCRGGMPLGGATRVGTMATWVISPHFTSIGIRRDDQSVVAEKIVAALKTGTKLFAIEGASGVGKTAASIILLDRIIVDTTVRDVARNVRYCDLSASPQSIDDLLTLGESGWLEDTSLIIDNFHRIAAGSMRRFNDFLRGGEPLCRMVLLLAQPREFFTLAPSANIGALKIAEKQGTLYKLASPRPRDIQSAFSGARYHDRIATQLDAMGIAADAPVRWVAHANLQRVWQMALHEQAESIRDVLLAPHARVGSPDGHRGLLRLIAAISALSLHRGIFTAGDLKRCLRSFVKRQWFFSLELWRLYREFEQLRRAGFILKAINRRGVFVFHEAMAEHFKDRLHGSTAFWEAFKKAGTVVRTLDWVRNNPLMTWLFAVELRDERSAQIDFPDAMLSGAFGVMRKTLQRNPKEGLEMALKYERGLLAERVGAWGEAREALAGAVHSSDANTDAKARATIAQVEAEHGPHSGAMIAVIASNPAVSDLVRLSARYWQIHLAAHEGRFDINGLAEILSALEDNRASLEAGNKYEYLHLARRAYFDTARFHYLVGTCDGKFIAAHSERNIARYLSLNLATFDPYCDKFLRAHLIHYDCIFSLKVLGRKLSSADEAVIDPKLLDNLEEMIRVAIRYYRSSADLFSVFGDKTAKYITPRILELELMSVDADPDQLKPKLNEYKSNIDATGLLELAPYPDVYYFKFHVRQHQLSMARAGLEGAQDFFEKVVDVELTRAEIALSRALSGFIKCGNSYGECMCHMFAAMLSFLKDAQGAASSRSNVRSEAERLGYVRIVNALTPEKLHPKDVYNTITYFPFVHQ